MKLHNVPIESGGEFAIAGKPDRNGIIEIVYAGYRWRVKLAIRDCKIAADVSTSDPSAQVGHEILSYEKLEGATE